MSERQAEAFHVADYIEDELAARGWNRADLAARMGGDARVWHCALDLLLETRDPGLRIGRDGAGGLAAAFETSAELWLGLERAWLAGQGAAASENTELRDC